MKIEGCLGCQTFIIMIVVSGESSTFTASMMTSVVDPGAVAAGIPSVMSMATKQEDIDPTKPNDHPILKVRVYMYTLYYYYV